MKKPLEQGIFIASFLAPALLLFTTFVAIPSVRALGYSLRRWDGLSKPVYIGFKNFTTLFRDSDLFLTALNHNLFLMAAGGSLTLLLALFFAAVLHRRIRGAALFRVAFFFPNVIASVAIALLWVLLYSTTNFGVVNNLLLHLKDALAAIGVAWPSGWALPFPFVDSKYVIYSIVPMMVWTATGFYMVLFLAAMENIPETFYEAARLDGASAFAQFRYITFPLIREVFTVGLVFLVIGTLKFFDAIWVMENQWPTKESHVLATVLYQKVFTEYNVGYGSAVAVLLFILVFLATLLTLRLSRKEALEY
ncbi:MAG: sugar ABC transporter permease [Candidatus Hydrogenedentes bacterium]|nr:sugar ABC transporter permease [Candidatus Hydrogenedentota bacterium]